ncbi:MAG: mycofactocin-associated electron transfer flavoprotein beta subunit [Actinomycetia bacterium]|nr:mycofactocin-associated electron transfer flavoprotein beta subunit [Actinomycetes bacterium]
MSSANRTTEVVVCLKWVFQADEPSDARFAGMSPADHAALELALQWATHIGGQVTAITVGPAQADAVLREALACGATRAVRIDTANGVSSADVASAIASVARHAAWVWCGDYSIDNGSGSVPGYLAAALQASQALGVLGVTFESGSIVATRRVDGGRREVLDVQAPAVISVEGATARLRRASLTAMRAAASAPIEVVAPSIVMRTSEHIAHTYRPRARALASPTGAEALDRVRSLTAAGTSSAAHEVETLEPADAAARIVQTLREWGYL